MLLAETTGTRSGASSVPWSGDSMHPVTVRSRHIMLSNSTARWAWIALLAAGCGPSVNIIDGRSPTPPAVRAEVSDPFVLPAYSDDDEGLAAPVPTGVLMKLLEPSFADPRNQNLEAYRCTVHGSGVGVPEGYPNTYSVRAVKADDGGLVLAVKIAPDHRCRHRVTSWTARGSSEQWEGLVQRIEGAGFWSGSSTKKIVIEATDGKTFTLEGLRGGRYQVLAKHVPEEHDRIYAPCMYLFALAGGFAEPICD